MTAETIDASGVDMDTESAAQQMRAQAVEREREKAVDTIENLGTKEWLEQSLEDQAQSYPIMGREFMFTPVGNERAAEVMEIGSAEAQKLDRDDIEDLEDVDPDDLEDMPKFIRELRGTLEENCLDEYMAEEGMKKLPLEVLQRVFEDVVLGEGVSDKKAERAHKFRNQ